MYSLLRRRAIEGARYGVLAQTLYPEMVATDFSTPYVKNNPYPNLRTPDETAARMIELMDGLVKVEDSGRFVNIWSRGDIPW